MTRVCANCGTEVDDEALFCPTCGQPIEAGAQPDLPPAPEWPDTGGRQAQLGSDVDGDEPASAPAPPAGPAAPPAAGDHEAQAPEDAYAEEYIPPWRRERAPEPAAAAGRDQRESDAQEPEGMPRSEIPPVAAAAPPPPPAPPAAASVSAAPPRPSSIRPGAATDQQVLVTPTTLSGWLVGGGALVAVLASFLPWISFGSYTAGWGLASGINVLFAIVLLAVLAAIFLAHLLPDIPRRDLAFAGIGLLGVGIGLDRIGLGGAGIGAILFLLATLAVAIGGFVSLLGFDREVGGQRP